MKLEYFHKKGASMLLLEWMPPVTDEGEEEVIEAEFLLTPRNGNFSERGFTECLKRAPQRGT
jgi:hypothetical protein